MLECRHSLHCRTARSTVAESRGALQWDLGRRGRLPHPEMQQGPRWDLAPNVPDPVEHRNQGKGAARCGMDLHLRCAGRVRSLLAASGQWTALVGAECRRSARQPGFERGLKPGRTVYNSVGCSRPAFTTPRKPRNPTRKASRPPSSLTARRPPLNQLAAAAKQTRCASQHSPWESPRSSPDFGGRLHPGQHRCMRACDLDDAAGSRTNGEPETVQLHDCGNQVQAKAQA